MTRRLCNPCCVGKTPGPSPEVSLRASGSSPDVKSPLAAIVLAGGASRRMGRDKATMPFSGPNGETTLVEQAVTTLRRRCAPVFVVAAPGQPLPELDAVV